MTEHLSCRSHCCVRHGCKYSYDDCPVVTRKVRQDHACEVCDSDAEEYACALIDASNGWLVADEQIARGTPVIRGTRFTFAQVLAELSSGNTTLLELGAEYNLPLGALTELFQSLSAALSPNFYSVWKGK